MKPQKKTVTNRKTTKLSMVARKRRPSLEKSVDSDVKEENRVKGQDDSKKRINSEIETEKSSENGKKEKSRKAESIRFKSWKRIRGGFEKKIDRMFDTTEDTNNEVLSDAEQNKSTTSDEILSESLEQCSEESHKKLQNPARLHQQSKIINGTEIIYNYQWNVAGTQSPLPAKKRLKEFEKKSAKLNLDVKTNSKATAAKDSKNIERSTPGREISCKSSLSRTKKKTKAKQSPKKHPQKKTILAIKKSIIPVIKKRPRKEPKLVKCAHVASSLSLPMNEKTIKEAKGAKKMTTSKNKAIQGVILSQNTLEDDLSRVPKQKKTGHSKKKGNVKKGEVVQGSRFSRVESEKDSDEGLSEITKPCFSDKTLLPHPCYIEKEVPGNGGVSRKFRANTKNLINANRRLKKSLRNPKVYSDADFSRSSSFDDDVRNQKSKVTACQLKNATKEENELIKLNVKVERVKDKADSAESDEDFEQKCRSGKETRDKSRVSSEERAMTNRMKLFGFWSGPKRHRVASLNALAKVHCLYENENGGVYLGGFCKPKIEKEKCKDMDNRIDRKELDDGKKSIMDKKNKDEDHSLNSMRKLRNVPGLRGKHYDIFEASTSSSSDEGSKSPKVTQKGRRRKEKLTVKSSRMRERESRKVELEKIKNREGDIKRNLKSAPDRKNDQKRRKKSAETIDLKNMVGSKRMASLNASAILAASYSDEKNRIGTSSDTSSSNESDMEFFKIRKASDIDVDSTKQHQSGSDVDDLLNPSKKVVIVNQDTDVTITGQ